MVKYDKKDAAMVDVIKDPPKDPPPTPTKPAPKQ
jgi:hypothetical protein